MTTDAAIRLYATHARTLAARYDTSSTEALLAGLTDLLPDPPAPVLDVGAGSGRDSAWFAARGHAVTAAEPVAAFRAMIASRLPAAALVDAVLPGLPGVAGAFALILVNAVWHHLAEGDRSAAMQRLAGLLAPSGLVLLSLRHGPVPPGQPLFALDPEAEIARAARAGLALRRRHQAPAQDAETARAGISWTWLALTRAG